MAGLFLAIPCLVTSRPFFRVILVGITCVPFVAATALLLAPPIAGFRARLAYLCSWCGTHPVNRRARSFDAASLLQLIVATAVLAIAIAVVIAVPGSGRWLPVRWLAGGIMILAFGEMLTACVPLVATALGLTVPLLMQSPWRSASVAEFWTKRWNIFVSEKVLRPYCFAPLAPRSVALALFAAFGVSGVFHVLLAFIALGRWRIALICGAFFLVQPLLIAAERRLAVRRWRPAAGRAWTLTALAIASPLFVEPMLQATGLGIQDPALPQAAGALGCVIVLSGMVSLASLASCSTRT